MASTGRRILNIPEPIAPLDAGRIQQIETTLDANSGGPGQPLSTRETWGTLAQLKSFQEIVSAIVEIEDEPIPELTEGIYLDYVRTGKQTAYNTFERETRPRFVKLVLAECIDNKGRFLNAIHRMIQAFCAERTWVHSFHDPKLKNWRGKATEIDLRVASISWSLSTACHFLGDKLDAGIRKLVQQELERRLFQPFLLMLNGHRIMLNQSKSFSWLELCHNWNASCLGGVVSAALGMINSKDERARYIAAAERYSVNFLAGFLADGSCSEGIGYWSGGFGHFVMLSETIWQATHGAVDLLTDKRVKSIAQYGARLEIMPRTYPAFADCTPGTVPSADLMRFVSLRYGLGLQMWENADPKPSNLQNVAIYSFPNSASEAHHTAKTSTNRGLRSWFVDASLFVGRPYPTKLRALGVAFKGGNNAEFHNHNDLGSFVVAINGKLLLTDPGSEEYTSRTFSDHRYDSHLLNSYGHSVPIVAGALQHTGAVAQATAIQTSFDDEQDVVTYDLRSAYDVKDLKKLERTFLFCRRGLGHFMVSDDVQFLQPQLFGTALITTAQWWQLDLDCLIISNGKEVLQVEVQVEGSEFEIASERIEEEVRTEEHPIRIGINLTTPIECAVIKIIVKPA